MARPPPPQVSRVDPVCNRIRGSAGPRVSHSLVPACPRPLPGDRHECRAVTGPRLLMEALRLVPLSGPWIRDPCGDAGPSRSARRSLRSSAPTPVASRLGRQAARSGLLDDPRPRIVTPVDAVTVKEGGEARVRIGGHERLIELDADTRGQRSRDAVPPRSEHRRSRVEEVPSSRVQTDRRQRILDCLRDDCRHRVRPPRRCP